MIEILTFRAEGHHHSNDMMSCHVMSCHVMSCVMLRTAVDSLDVNRKYRNGRG